MSNILEFNINPNSPISVYIQIENLIQFAIVSGMIAPSEALPSVRVLSKELSTNPNTVTKAYRDLEIRGLVQPCRGVGVVVTGNAVKLCKELIQKQSKSHLFDAVSECLVSGFSAKEIRKIVTDVVDSKPLPYTPSGNY